MTDTTATGQDTTAPAGSEATAATEAASATAVAQAAATTQAAAPAGAPDSYADFKTPDGFNLGGLADEVKGLAKELNLPQEQAQKVVDIGAKLAQQQQQEHQKLVQSARDQWRERIQGDKEFGGPKLDENLARAKAAMEASSTPELQHLLATTGLGDHPEIIRHFLKIAPSVLPDTHVPGGRAPTSGKSAAQILYDTQN